MSREPKAICACGAAHAPFAASESGPPAIEAQDLTVRLGGHTALENVSFSLPTGAFLSVIGPNGAGKTTLLRVILGLVSPTAGRLRVFEHDPHCLPPGSLSYVPQHKNLDRSFPGRTYELVATGKTRRWPWLLSKAQRSEAIEALNRLGSAHLADKPIGSLSGGELQRAFLARAFIGRPKLLVLDEPSTGIDLAGEADMYVQLERYQAETQATVILITHDLNAVCHLCSNILVINQRLVSYGPATTALTEEHLRRAFGHVGHQHAMLLNARPDV